MRGELYAPRAEGRPPHRRRVHPPLRATGRRRNHRSPALPRDRQGPSRPARGNLIFGLHVHVGIKDKDVALELANQVRYFLPHLLALTTSSTRLARL